MNTDTTRRRKLIRTLIIYVTWFLPSKRFSISSSEQSKKSTNSGWTPVCGKKKQAVTWNHGSNSQGMIIRCITCFWDVVNHLILACQMLMQGRHQSYQITRYAYI